MSIDPLINSTIPNIKEKRKMNSNFLLVLKLQISKRLKRKIKPGNQVLKLLLKVLKI